MTTRNQALQERAEKIMIPTQTLGFSLGSPVHPDYRPVHAYRLLRQQVKRHEIVMVGDMPFPRTRAFVELLLSGCGARCRNQVTPTTTLVISTLRLDNELDMANVNKAMSLGIKIVSYKWLDDIVTSNLAKSIWFYSIPYANFRRLNTDEVDRLTNVEHDNFLEGCRLARQDMNGTDIYHLYRNAAGFQHNVALTRFRADLNETEVIRLRVYEHHVSHSLHSVAIFHLPHPTCPLDFTISHHGSETLPPMSPFAFFEYIFKGATGYSWKWRPWGFSAEKALVEGNSPGLEIETPLSCRLRMEKGHEDAVVCKVEKLDRTAYMSMGRSEFEMEDGFEYERPADGKDGMDDWVMKEGVGRWGIPPRRIGEGGRWVW